MKKMHVDKDKSPTLYDYLEFPAHITSKTETGEQQRDVENSQLTTEDRWEDLYKIIMELKHKIEKIESARNNIKMKVNRKNDRVYYIPKKPLYENVLRRLRQDGEPLKVVMEKVFKLAAKSLGVQSYE